MVQISALRGMNVFRLSMGHSRTPSVPSSWITQHPLRAYRGFSALPISLSQQFHSQSTLRYPSSGDITDGSVETTVAEFIVQSLVDTGVTHVFGGHGGAICEIINAVENHPQLEWIYCRNELSACMMAASMAKMTGTLGCCVSTAGPGATNLVTGLVDSALDRVPVVVLTGKKPTSHIAYTEFQDIDQSAIFRAARIDRSEDLINKAQTVPLFRDLIATALSKRTVVHLSLPLDIQRQKISVPPALPSQIRRMAMIAAPEVDVEATARDIAAKRRRVLLALGRRAVAAGPEILKLAEVMNAPIITRMDAKGCVDESHPLVVGVAGAHGKPGLERARAMIESSDIVMTIGVEDHSFFLTNLAGIQAREMIDIEPDAALVNPRWRARHTLTGNVQETIRMLHQAIRRFQSDRPPLKLQPRGDGMDEVWQDYESGNWGEGREKALSMCKGKPYKLSPGYCHPGVVLEKLGPMLGPDDVLSMDVGEVNLWTMISLTLTKGQRTLASERLGTMGYALCGAIAAALARRHAKSFILAGDGGFQMTLNELAILKQHNLNNIVVIVFDNKELARVKFEFANTMGTYCPGPDYVKLMQSYGGDGVALSSEDEIDAALNKAFASQVPYLIHVHVDPACEAYMARSAEQRILDSEDQANQTFTGW